MIGKSNSNTGSSFPEYTYSGSSIFIDDGNGEWRIKLLTSGILNFSKLLGKVDIFLVGGGGGGGGYDRSGGGGGGYTATELDIQLLTNTNYPITIGAGGARYTGYQQPGYDGGATTAFGITAGGGKGGKYEGAGGDGGSGGGGSTTVDSKVVGNGGFDGNNGSAGNYGAGGTGQGSTTREFGEPNGKLYAGGGGGGRGGVGGEYGAGNGGGYGNPNQASDALANTGCGGGGANNTSNTRGGAGGSGIVIIRKHKTSSITYPGILNIYNNGQIETNITNGLALTPIDFLGSGSGYRPVGSAYASYSNDSANNILTFTVNTGFNQCILRTVNLIDLTNYSLLNLDTYPAIANDRYFLAVVLDSSLNVVKSQSINAVSSWAAMPPMTLTNITGLHYIGIAVWAPGSAETYYIRNWKLS